VNLKEVDMYQIVYFSSAKHPYSKEEIVAILNVSRRNNAQHGISGMLLYKDGNIMQVLEGEQDVVEKRFDVIQCDPRHKGVIVINRSEIPERQFGEWSMGFRDLADPAVKALPGFNEVLRNSLALEDLATDVTATKALLQMFASGEL